MGATGSIAAVLREKMNGVTASAEQQQAAVEFESVNSNGLNGPSNGSINRTTGPTVASMFEAHMTSGSGRKSEMGEVLNSQPLSHLRADIILIPDPTSIHNANPRPRSWKILRSSRPLCKHSPLNSK